MCIHNICSFWTPRMICGLSAVKGPTPRVVSGSLCLTTWTRSWYASVGFLSGMSSAFSLAFFVHLQFMGLGDEFRAAVHEITGEGPGPPLTDNHNFTFDRDIQVHVFETTIRALGGLLSAHQLVDRVRQEIRYGMKAVLVASQGSSS